MTYLSINFVPLRIYMQVRLICCAGPIAFRQTNKIFKTRKHFVLFKMIKLYLNWLHTAPASLSEHITINYLADITILVMTFQSMSERQEILKFI